MNGELLVIGAQLVFAVSAVFVKKLTTGLSPLLVTSLIVLVGCVALLPALAVSQKELLSLNRQQVLLVILSGVLWVGLGAFLYISGLSKTGLARTSIVALVYPLFVSLLSFAVLGERPSARFFVAAAFFIAGYLVLTA